MHPKFNNLLLHPNTKAQIRHYINKPSQVLLIIAADGAGKITIAKHIAKKLLQLPESNYLDSHPYFIHLAFVNGKEISIERIRELIKKLKLKTTGNKKIRRVVILENAESMSIEAQNALLKTLEEPSLDTVFILTTVSDKKLLPTITSRARKLYISPIRLDDATEFFRHKATIKEIEVNWQLSHGSAGLLNALISSDSNNPLKLSIVTAKKFIKSNQYERLIILSGLNNRVELQEFLGSLSKVLNALHRSYIRKQNKITSRKILNNRKLIYELLKSLDDNTNIKLIQLRLLLNLSI